MLARRLACILGGLVAAPVAGCSLLFSVDDLAGGTPQPEGGGAAESGPHDGAAHEGATEAASESAGHGADGGCVCLSAVPAGWTVVAFDATSAASCPLGYGSPLSLSVDPSLAPLGCTCTCDVSAAPACGAGNFTELHTSTPGCAGAPARTLAANGGACTPTSFGNLGAYHETSGPAPVGGSCAPSVAKAPPPGGTSGVACAASASAAPACAGGGSCAPDPGPSFDVCILRADAVPCPTGFSHAHSAGTSVVDTRDCTACSCPTPTATCSGTLLFFSDTACTKQVGSLPADGVCTATPGAPVANAYEYQGVTQGAACGPPQTPSTATGSASLAGAVTICCP
jgi:hypothetical protein